MNYSLACRAINHAGKLGLNDGRFAFIMLDLDFDLTGNRRKNVSAFFKQDWNESAFQSALLLAVDNKVNAEYLAFIEDLKTKSSGSPFYFPNKSNIMVSTISTVFFVPTTY